LVSVVDDTSVIVIRAPAGQVALTCGGAAMVAAGTDAPRAEAQADAQDGTLLGKRYVDEAETVQVLVTKAGRGTLALDGAVLAVQAAKSLPSSD
jgi:hypothetical protein